jgi:hypothetical protein
MSKGERNVTRMFPMHQGPSLLSACQLRKLARAMVNSSNESDIKVVKKSTSKNTEQNQDERFQAGYTYLGQFIAHDIVPKTNPRKIDRETVRPELNLDSLYGNTSDFEGSPLFDNQCFFQHKGKDFDVLRDKETGQAKIPEVRNDENVIIIQFHRLWQKTHDHVIKNHVSKDLTRSQKIHEAYQIVMAIFHLIVIKDFLAKLIDKDVYDYYFKQSSDSNEYILGPGKLKSIPLEFSLAGFRFGHSMVLSRYVLRKNSLPVEIKNLLRTATSGYLKAEEKINWEQFFNIKTDVIAQEANLLDLDIDLPKVPDEGNIVFINLKAAQKSCLPSGFHVRNFIQDGYKTLSNQVKLNSSERVKVDNGEAFGIIKRNFDNDTVPLWLYILAESAFSEPSRRVALGKIGSIIVSEVLRESILSCYQTRSIQKLADVAGEFANCLRIHGGINMASLLNLITSKKGKNDDIENK